MSQVIEVVTLSDSDDEESSPLPAATARCPDLQIAPQASPPCCTNESSASWFTVFNSFYRSRLSEARKNDPEVDVQVHFEAVKQEWESLSAEKQKKFATDVCGVLLSPLPGERKPTPATALPRQPSACAAPAEPAKPEPEPSLDKIQNETGVSTAKSERRESDGVKSEIANAVVAESIVARTESLPCRPTSHASGTHTSQQSKPTGKLEVDAVLPNKATKLTKDSASSHSKLSKHVHQQKGAKNNAVDERRALNSGAKGSESNRKARDKKQDKKKEKSRNLQETVSDQSQKNDGERTHKSGIKKLSEDKDKRKDERSSDRSNCDTAKIEQKHSLATSEKKKNVNGVVKKKKGSEERATTQPSTSEIRRCQGPGCKNAGREDKDWDKREFCCYQCCINYGNLVFKRFVALRKKQHKAGIEAEAKK